MSRSALLDRRDFLKTTAAGAGGLFVAFYLPARATAAEPIAATDAALNAWIHIGTDETVTLFVHKAEMGQGTVTSLPMLLAEELECDWSRVRTEFPGVDRAYGPSQGVFGSASIRSSWDPLRKAGATAREMLVAAAATRWGVSPSACRAENGFVVNAGTNARASFGSLAADAARLTPPANPPLKDPKQFHLIGTSPKRLDTPGKVDGSTTFGIDVRLPGMKYAAIERCPVFGGTLVRFDDTKAKAVPGVTQVVRISNGVAVVADNTWSAMQGRKALTISWNEGRYAASTSESIRSLFATMVEGPGAEARKEGDAASALSRAAKRLDAIYEAPYLSHSPMEPLNCTAVVRPDSCEVWASTQNQTAAQQAAARVTGLAPERIKINSLYMGGGFGRRAGSDYVTEAVEVAKAVSGPVKVQWSREDDMQHDTYRPAAYVHFAGGVDEQGWPVALTARVACPAFAGPRPGVDRTAVEGLADLAYAIPHVLVEYYNPDAGIPTSYWRSVGYSQNTFFLEAFLDELAAAGGKDPLEVRRRLLAGAPRMRGVLELAASKAGWGTALATGRGRGLAVVDNIGSFTAQVAEVTVSGSTIRVDRVVAAVDCGHVINPAIVAQQIRSGIVFGLSAALKGAITIDRGRVREGNFDKYDVIRMSETPVVEVHIVPSQERPGGIGEASVPGIAPAVANAVFAATGQRVRKLPMRLQA